MGRTKVALASLGCKLNQAEIESLTRQFAEAGYELVSPAEKADVYVLNTCTVTHTADRKSRHLLRLAHNQNPDARLVAIGCYAEREPQKLAGIEGVELVVSNEHIPHGIRYSLTLHNSNNIRVLGYDNAHAIKPKKKKYGAKRVVWDHKHKKKTIEVYEFESAAQLLEDFWNDVESFLTNKKR